MVLCITILQVWDTLSISDIIEKCLRMSVRFEEKNWNIHLVPKPVNLDWRDDRWLWKCVKNNSITEIIYSYNEEKAWFTAFIWLEMKLVLYRGRISIAWNNMYIPITNHNNVVTVFQTSSVVSCKLLNNIFVHLFGNNSWIVSWKSVNLILKIISYGCLGLSLSKLDSKWF